MTFHWFLPCFAYSANSETLTLFSLISAECHGTGTPVGDPIEVKAVSSAMNDSRNKDQPLLIGAVCATYVHDTCHRLTIFKVKANIGHSEAASGIFAVMKAALMTEAGVIPGVCGLKNVNPKSKQPVSKAL